MKPTVYLETTIPSYLTAWPSRDLVRAAHQQITKEWWDQRSAYELVTSRLVLVECGQGDPTAAAERLSSLVGIPLLEQTSVAGTLAKRIRSDVPLPAKAEADSLHVAICAVHAVRFLVTWNCTHLANGILRPRVEDVCRLEGYVPPQIVTPEQLFARDRS